MVGKPFEKGKSGNPSGRPKIPECVREMARAHTETAIKTLAEICSDRKAAQPARVSAAQALLDRAWGKPVQVNENTVTGKDGGAIATEFTIRFVNSDGNGGPAT